MRILDSLDEDLGFAAGLLVRGKPRLYDPRVIEYEEVAHAQQRRQVCEVQIRSLFTCTEQATAPPVRRRVPGDQFLGQLVIKVGNEHGRAW